MRPAEKDPQSPAPDGRSPGWPEEDHYQTASLTWIRIRTNNMLIVGGIVVILYMFMAVIAPYLTGYTPTKMDIRHRFAPPTAKHLMGTDQYGRDTLTRVLYGARISFEVGLISVLIGMIGGVIMGALAGFFRGFLDELSMRFMDALLAFPPLLLALGLVASIGPSLITVAVTIGVVHIPRFARVMRSSVLAEREKEYVEAARAIGQSNLKILLKHIGPTSISPVIVLGTVVFAQAVIIEATLSFLGVGVPPPTPSWGSMLNEARRYLDISIWMPLFPGLILTIAVLGFNLLGDGLRDFLDPKTYAAIRASGE